MAECTTTKIKKSIILSMDVRERLETMSENVSILIKQITRNDALSNQTSILLFQEYQQRLLASFQNVSNSCTNLSVMFIRPPSPKLNETGVLCSKIETATLNLASTFFQYKLEWGNCLHKEIKIAVIEVLEEVSKLGQILMTEGCRKDSQLRLRGVGKVWEQCSGRLSHDEKSAVVKVCMSQLQLLRDACQEVDDLLERNGASDDLEGLFMDMLNIDSSEGHSDTINGTTSVNGDDINVSTNGGKDYAAVEWCNEDKPLVSSSVELIKITENLLDNVIRNILVYGEANGPGTIEELDKTVNMILQLSPCVDEIASILDAPIDFKLVLSHCLNLSSLISECIKLSRECHFSKAALNGDSEGWNGHEIMSKLERIKQTLDKQQQKQTNT